MGELIRFPVERCRVVIHPDAEDFAFGHHITGTVAIVDEASDLPLDFLERAVEAMRSTYRPRVPVFSLPAGRDWLVGSDLD